MEGHVDMIMVNSRTSFQLVLGGCYFSPFQILQFVGLFTTKHVLGVDNEVILLSNNWIWY
jgi:hypothetical protein